MFRKIFSLFVLIGIMSLSKANAQSKTEGSKDREFWLAHLDKLARPVLSNLAKDELKKEYAG
jgi:hypothetical protein